MPNQAIVVVTNDHTWGKGATLEDAIDQCWKAGSSGKHSSVIYLYTGDKDALKQITVNSFGAVEYPSSATSHTVGFTSLYIRKKKAQKKAAKKEAKQ